MDCSCNVKRFKALAQQMMPFWCPKHVVAYTVRKTTLYLSLGLPSHAGTRAS